MPLIPVPDERSMLELGETFSAHLGSGDVVYLEGDLGAGKTTLVKGVLKGLGFDGNVTSPTYTLVEPYDLAKFSVYHFDLYRLESADELEMIGIRDMVGSSTVILVEWPENGCGVLPAATRIVRIEYAGEGREVSIESHLTNSGKHR